MKGTSVRHKLALLFGGIIASGPALAVAVSYLYSVQANVMSECQTAPHDPAALADCYHHADIFSGQGPVWLIGFGVPYFCLAISCGVAVGSICFTRYCRE